MKLRPATFKHIEAELYAYHDTKKEIERLRESILYGYKEVDENVGGGRNSEVSRPTERIATRLMTNRRLRNLEEVVEAIHKVYNQSTAERKRMIEVRYWNGPKLTWDEVANKSFISKRQALRWRDEIVYTIAEVLGWR